MTTVSDPKLPGNERGYLTGFLKFLFFIIALVAVMLTVLFNMGGSSDVLKSSLEKFISDTFGGRPTFIGRLHRISFFPVVGVDFEELQVRETQSTQELSLSAKKFKAFVTFWGMIVKKTEITALYMEDLRLRGGFVGKRDLTIEKIFIDHNKGTKKAEINSKGSLDSLQWSLSLGMEVSGSVGGYRYSFGKDRPIVFTMDKIHLSATITEQIDDYISLESLSMGDDEANMSGNLSVSLLEGQQVKINGRLVTQDQKNIMKPDVIIDYSVKPIKVSGEIAFSQIDTDSLKGKNGPFALIDKVHELVIFQPEVSESGSTDQKTENKVTNEQVYVCNYSFDLKITTEAQNKESTNEQDPITYQAQNKDHQLKIIPAKGNIQPYEGPCESHPFF